jgi:hypothetical protein
MLDLRAREEVLRHEDQDSLAFVVLSVTSLAQRVARELCEPSVPIAIEARVLLGERFRGR